MIEIYNTYIKKLFIPQDIFSNNEWMLKHQIFMMLIVSFSLGIGLFLFAIYRVTHDNVLVGVGQFIFAFFLLYGFIKSRHDKTFYKRYTMILFFVFFINIYSILFCPSKSSKYTLDSNSTCTYILFFR